MATDLAIRLLVYKLVPRKYRLGYKEELEKLSWNLELTFTGLHRLHQSSSGGVLLDAENCNAPPLSARMSDLIIRRVASIVSDTSQLLALCDQRHDYSRGRRKEGSLVADPFKSIRLVVCMFHQYKLGQRLHRLNQRFEEIQSYMLLMRGLSS